MTVQKAGISGTVDNVMAVVCSIIIILMVAGYFIQGGLPDLEQLRNQLNYAALFGTFISTIILVRYYYRNAQRRAPKWYLAVPFLASFLVCAIPSIYYGSSAEIPQLIIYNFATLPQGMVISMAGVTLVSVMLNTYIIKNKFTAWVVGLAVIQLIGIVDIPVFSQIEAVLYMTFANSGSIMLDFSRNVATAALLARVVTGRERLRPSSSAV